jgi:uncharacterized membrane protein YvbJ
LISTIGKAGVTAAALLAGPDAVTFVIAQALPPTVDQGILQWAIEKGGAFAVILIILFFYRRDYVQLTDFWKKQTETLVTLVEENTKAQTETSAALRENTVVVHHAKNVMATYLPDIAGKP